MNFKNTLLSLSFGCSFILTFFLYKGWSFAKWLDALFLIGLLLIMVYFVMVLIEGQFFAAFFKSTQNFFAKVNKKDALIRESEKRTSDSGNYRREFPNRISFLHIGLFFCLGSLILSFVLYYWNY